jgi:hydroxyacylglutathione hydrolase
MVMATPLEILCVPALEDNYIWIIRDADADQTVIVDPGESAPVIAALDARGWKADAIWVTHWHPDHTDGIAALKAEYGATVTGPAAEAAKIPTLDRTVGEGDTLAIGDHVATVIETPGHTAGHITLRLTDDALLFPGDTLFAMGCGRLFEGTAEQMYRNMVRLAALPPETVAYGAHEYTIGNGKYALAAEPDNQAVKDRMVEVEARRAAGEPTLPTTIALERATNPFMRASSAEELAARRAAKDNFRG